MAVRVWFGARRARAEPQPGGTGPAHGGLLPFREPLLIIGPELVRTLDEFNEKVRLTR